MTGIPWDQQGADPHGDLVAMIEKMRRRGYEPPTYWTSGRAAQARLDASLWVQTHLLICGKGMQIKAGLWRCPGCGHTLIDGSYQHARPPAIKGLRPQRVIVDEAFTPLWTPIGTPEPEKAYGWLALVIDGLPALRPA